MNDCEHTLPLGSKFFASRGRGRRCTRCGEPVYVPTTVFDGILAATFIPVGMLFIAAWLHGGVYWVALALALMALVFFLVFETRTRPPVGFDEVRFHRHTKRNLIILAVFVAGLLAISFWLA